MNYLQRKKLALMMNRKFKGYLRTVSGVPLTLTDCMGSELMSLSVVGNIVQDDTPSVDAPAEVQGVGERTVNLFDMSSIQDGGYNTDGNHVTYSSRMCYRNGILTVNYGAYANALYMDATPISLEANKTYTMIAEVYSEISQTVYFGHEQIPLADNAYSPRQITTISLNEWQRISFSFTPTSGGEYLFLLQPAGNAEQYLNLNMQVKNIMLVEGEYTADPLPDYEPYGYKIPLTVSGRNLFDTKTAKKNSGAVSLLEVTDNSLTVGQTGAGLWASVNVLISEELIGKTVTVSADISTSGANKGGIRIMWLNGALGVTDLGYIISSYVSSSTPQRISMTGVVPENTTENEYKLCLMFYSNVNATLESGVEYTATYSNIQIELGDTATAYEPYCTPETYNIYSDTPLYGTEGEEYTVPAITTFKGTTIITPETSVQPTDMTAQYYASKP